MLTKAKYIALTLTAKKATWLKLLLIKLRLLKVSDQYVKIKVIQRNSWTNQIPANIGGKKKEAISSKTLHFELEKIFTIKKALPSKTIIANIPFLLKSDN